MLYPEYSNVIIQISALNAFLKSSSLGILKYKNKWKKQHKNGKPKGQNRIENIGQCLLGLRGENLSYIGYIGYDFGVSRHFQQYFSYIVAVRKTPTCHWLTLSYNVVSSTPRLIGVQTHNVSSGKLWLHRSLYIQLPYDHDQDGPFIFNNNCIIYECHNLSYFIYTYISNDHEFLS